MYACIYAHVRICTYVDIYYTYNCIDLSYAQKRLKLLPLKHSHI